MDENSAAPATLSSRMAALNMNQVGRMPGHRSEAPQQGSTQAEGRPPGIQERSKSASSPPIQTMRSREVSQQIGNRPLGSKNDGILPPPALERRSVSPSQTGTSQSKPSLPPRRPSSQAAPPPPPRTGPSLNKRRDSTESVASNTSTVSSRSGLSNGTSLTSKSRTSSIDASNRIKAPAYDPTKLPPIQAKREVETPPSKPPRPTSTRQSQPATNGFQSSTQPSSRPPLPTRTSNASGTNELRRLPPETPPSAPRRSALSWGMNNSLERPPPVPSARPSLTSTASADDASISENPPPIPRASKPNQAQLAASKSQATAGVTGVCLKCRDFSSADHHASRFPRQSLPSSSLDWLAENLTRPFPSATDKARVIFTWLHHNVEYDVKSFFGGTVKPSTPQGTLSSGLAVCEGYGGLFAALATKSGLECFVVGGHGKGYGFTAHREGSPVPPYNPSGHAWNAVKIDDGEWKLVDPCWGAGTVGGPGQPYNKRFSPGFFTMDNDEFGLRHFPSSKDHFFRTDGRTPSWEEYIIGDGSGEPPQIYTGAQDDHHLSETSFLPRCKMINVSQPAGPTVRFQYEKICQHFDPVKAGKGKPYCFILRVKKPSGQGDDFVPLETNGMFWWADVPVHQLGRAGDDVMLFAVTTVSGQDARGMTVQEYLAAKGRKGMGFGGVAKWELV